jgi:hypothetical protein
VSLGKQVPFPPRLGRLAEYDALAAHIVENAMPHPLQNRAEAGFS